MNLKQKVGIRAAEFIKNGMIVGLGTGSTAAYFVAELGRRIQEEGLQITGVTTSIRTKEQAQALGIPLKSVDEIDRIDITVDGADEISADFQGIKGGGGAHLYEKIVAVNSAKIIWIVDESKMVEQLGAFPLPIEVIPYGSQQLYRRFDEKGYRPVFRCGINGERFQTDEKNYIIDLHLGVIAEPHKLAQELEALVGVVAHGLFLDCVDTVLIGTQTGVESKQAVR